MHTVRSENVDGSRERRGHRGNEYCTTPIVKFFNDESGDQSFLNLGQRRPPRLVLTLPRQSLSKASKEFVARNSVEQRGLDSLPSRTPYPSANCDPNDEADSQDEQQGKKMFRG